MNATDHKCPACSASLPFDPTTGTWKCEYCGTTYTIEDLEKVEAKNSEREAKKDRINGRKMDVDEYSCPNCGAKIVTDENTTATFCVYCGSTSIIKNRLRGMYQPDMIIPFKTTKEQAIEAFKKCTKGKLFAPSDFAKKEQIEKISGVYIPFWLYDCVAEGEISGTAEKINTWTAGDYRYTKTDTFEVARSGKATFDKVPVDGSKKFDDDIMDSIEPFSYDELKDFSASYLSGFLAEKYDVDEDEAYSRAKERVNTTFRDELKRDITGYTTVSASNEKSNISSTKADYAMFPVWMLNIKYKDKLHTFAMNGQTGKMIGNVPICVSKALFWALGVFLGSFGILSLILYLI